MTDPAKPDLESIIDSFADDPLELLAAVAIATGGGFHAALLAKWAALNTGSPEPVAGLSPDAAEIVEMLHGMVAGPGRNR